MEVLTVGRVPVLHRHAEGPTSVALLFLAGIADERFTRTGLGHLVEHLVMTQLSKPAFEHNATVDVETTAFVARTTPRTAGTFLHDVCAAIRTVAAGVDPSVVERELGVLAAESAGFSYGGTTLTEVYGLRGPGLAGVEPPALAHLTADGAAQWARRLLVDGNAVLAVTGPLPPDLDLDLPTGPRNTRTAPSPTYLARPAQRADAAPSLVLALELPPPPVGAVAARVVEDRLLARLRTTLGVSYHVDVDQVRVDPDTLHVSFAIDAAPGREREVAVEALRELRRLATEGPGPEDLAHDLAVLDEVIRIGDPDEALLRSSAVRLLWGHESLDATQQRAEVAATTVQDVASALDRALGSLVVLLPFEEPLTAEELDGHPLPVAPECVDRPVEGRRLRRRLWRGLDDVPLGASLTLTDDALALRTPDDEWHVVRFAEAVGLGRRDRRAMLVGPNGCTLHLDAAAFRGGDEALRLLDERVDPAVRFPLDDLGAAGDR